MDMMSLHGLSQSKTATISSSSSTTCGMYWVARRERYMTKKTSTAHDIGLVTRGLLILATWIAFIGIMIRIIFVGFC